MTFREMGGLSYKAHFAVFIAQWREKKLDIEFVAILATLLVFGVKMLGVICGMRLLDTYQKYGANFLIAYVNRQDN